MNIVDSSGWLEFFGGTVNAKNFKKTILNEKNLLIPSITLFEVFKRLLIEYDESTALHYTAQMKCGKVVDLDSELALNAAFLSKQYKLPMADSIILATAQKYSATVWTQDADFKGLPQVKYFPKSKLGS